MHPKKLEKIRTARATLESAQRDLEAATYADERARARREATMIAKLRATNAVISARQALSALEVTP